MWVVPYGQLRTARGLDSAVMPPVEVIVGQRQADDPTNRAGLQETTMRAIFACQPGVDAGRGSVVPGGCDPPRQTPARAATPWSNKPHATTSVHRHLPCAPDRALAACARTTTSVPPDHDTRTARALPLHRTARGAYTVGSANSAIASGRMLIHDRLASIAGRIRRGLKERAEIYDPIFQRPDLVEDDYYRLRNQPRG